MSTMLDCKHIIALSTALLLAGCGITGDNPAGPKGNATLTVQLTDAPFPVGEVDRADIFVVRIDAMMAESDENSAAQAPAPAANADPAHGWVTIAEPNASYNLMDLQNGTTVNLGQTTLPTGTYHSFRLILDTDQSSITLKDGTVLDGNGQPGIKWPSAGQTGIKVKLAEPIDLVVDGTIMVIDFDLAHSFVMRGNSLAHNGLLFKPVLQATARDITGSISGTVRLDDDTGPLVEGALVEVLIEGTPIGDTDPANVVRSALTDANGEFTIAFAPPGTFALRATPPSTITDHDPAIIASVVVVTGQDTGGLLLVLPAKPGSISGTVRLDSNSGALVDDALVEVLKLGTAIDNADPANVVKSAHTDANGAFSITGLAPGDYALRATPPAAITTNDPVLVASVTVDAGSDTGGQVLVLPHK